VDTFLPLLLDPYLQRRCQLACAGLKHMDTAGVRRLLQWNGLSHLLRLDRGNWQINVGALGVLARICSLDDACFVPLLGEAGIVPKLVHLLLLRHSPPGQSIAADVLTTVLYADPVRIDEALRISAPGRADSNGSGNACVRGLLALAAGSAGGSRSSAVASLACMALKGTETHRRLLLTEDVLPPLVSVIARDGATSSSRDPSQMSTVWLSRCVDHVEALRLLLETNRTMTVEIASVVSSTTVADDDPSIARTSASFLVAAAVPLDASLRAQLEPLLHHWHPALRDKIAAILQQD
jgi:hypothetical protein